MRLIHLLGFVLFLLVLVVFSTTAEGRINVLAGQDLAEQDYISRQDIPDPIIQDAYLQPNAPPYLIREIPARAIITAYNSTPGQTDSTPFVTASGDRTKHGIVANNCLPFGTWVKIDGEIYEVKDRMNKRYNCSYFDIWMGDKSNAVDFGRQTKIIKIIK